LVLCCLNAPNLGLPTDSKSVVLGIGMLRHRGHILWWLAKRLEPRTASKSAIKSLASQASGQLFKMVALFTGSKNAMKGLFFSSVVCLCLQTQGFSERFMADGLGFCLGWCLIALSWSSYHRFLGRSQASKSTKALLPKPCHQISYLWRASSCRCKTRCLVFVVGVPSFCMRPVGRSLHGWKASLRAWTLGYGFVPSHCSVAREAAARKWSDSRGTSGPACGSFSLWLGALGVSRVGLVARKIRGKWVAVVGLRPIWLFFATWNSSFHSTMIFGLCRFRTKTAERCGLLTTRQTRQAVSWARFLSGAF